MRRIDRIIVSACRDDQHLLLICVSSIRFYYKAIPIYLIKDHTKGPFDSSEIEKLYNVKIYKTDFKYCGWGFSKLLPLINIEDERILILDSDTLFLGKVLDSLEAADDEVIVSGYMEQAKENVKRSYFDLDQLALFDPNFAFTGFVFNTGQLVYDTKHFQKEDFESLGVHFENESITSDHTEIFGYSEQGIVNYLVQKKAQLNQLSVEDLDFMLWPQSCDESINEQDLIHGERLKKVMHWAGPKDSIVQLLLYADVLVFFQKRHFQSLFAGGFRKTFRMIKRTRLRVILSFYRKAILKSLK